MGSYRTAVLILIGILSNLEESYSLTQEQSEQIDSVVELFQADNFAPGVSLSVVQDGEIVISKGYGKRNIANDLDVDNNTLFAIGSISKSMTSLLVVKILSEKFPDLGEAVLDTPINKLGNLNFTLSDRFRSESASFRDLLSHRTCINNDGTILLFEAASLEELIYRTRYDPELCSDRTNFVYNNAIYALAGSLIGQIAESTYPALMADLFLELGMTSSLVVDAEGSHEDLPNMSRAYTRLDNQVVEFDRAHLRRLHLAGGAGAVLSTASDMGKYVQFHMNGGQVGGIQVLPEDVLNWMYRASIPLEGFDFLSATGGYGYSLGLILAFYNGQPWVNHGGYWPPYESTFSLFPKHNNMSIGIFSSINGPGITGLVPDTLSQQSLHIIIMQILQGEIKGPDDILQAMPKIASKKLATSFDALYPTFTNKKHVPSTPGSQWTKTIGLSKRQSEYAGLYGSANHGEMTITLSPEGIIEGINYGKWGIGNLISKPPSINEFDVEWTTTINYDFYSYGPTVPIPVFSVVFESEGQYLDLVWDGVPYRFYRDATLDTFPEIPWSPESCGPETGTSSSI